MKKMLSIFVILLLVLLVGCGTADREPAKTQTSTQTQTPALQFSGLIVYHQQLNDTETLYVLLQPTSCIGIVADSDTEATAAETVNGIIVSTTNEGRRFTVLDRISEATADDCTEISAPEAELPADVSQPTQWYHAGSITVTTELPAPEKPVIYLYPTEETQVRVRLDYDGELTCTYPAYHGGWAVTADPDGTLTDADGQTYNYLYWEGVGPAEYDFSEGFCVAGGDTAAFLEQAVSDLGLTRREANEFLVYWLPQMQGNAYNLIAFQTDAYTDTARLTVTPTPDTVLRVFMTWQPLDTPVELPPQDLRAPERTGFTVVEWGGARIS